jgi:hypothetical protein
MDNTEEMNSLTSHRLSLLVGTIIGQISELLNCMCKVGYTNKDTYNSLRDIQAMAALQIHEIYYNGNKKKDSE